MKIAAYYCLHYGKEYLDYSMRSIRPFVDQIFVVHSKAPSFGSKTRRKNPDTEAELISSVTVDGVVWLETEAGTEEQHRRYIMDHIEGYDYLFHVDYDEVWDLRALVRIKEELRKKRYREYRVGFRHLYRSFDWICDDPMMPTRFINLKKKEGVGYLDEKGYHFGYAINPKLMQYKWDIHGHKQELKKGWFTDVYSKFPEIKEDVHPTCDNTWNVQAFNKEELPVLMKAHPYYGKDIID